MTQATITRHRRRDVVKSKLEDMTDRVDVNALGMTCCMSLGTLSFGYYALICAIAGGALWLWFIPYAVLAALCLGYGIWCAMSIVR
jgi:hypothetical protein